MGDLLCRHCEQARDAGPVMLTFRKQDRAWGVEKRTSLSKRKKKKRKGLAAKRDKRHRDQTGGKKIYVLGVLMRCNLLCTL